jgi:hypothetical protein
MGTRSLTTFIEPYQDKNGKQKNEKIVTMYRQYDGYPSGHGIDLAEFLASGTMVNGFSPNEEKLVFNGMGCLAAQVIAHFKEGVGGFYLHRGGVTNCCEEYRYEVITNGAGQDITLRCYDVYDKKWIFEGTPKEFIQKYKKVEAV